MVVDSRALVKDSARLSLRGVHGVAAGVDFKWLELPQAGVGAELRLIEEKTRGRSSENAREHHEKGRPGTRGDDWPGPGSPDASCHVCSPLTHGGLGFPEVGHGSS